MGARERDPQRRGLKLARCVWFWSHGVRERIRRRSARLKKRSRRCNPSSMRSMEVAYDSLKYPGAPKASPGTSATRVYRAAAWPVRWCFWRARCRQCVREMRRNIGECVKRAARLLAGHAGNGAQAVHDAAPPLGISASITGTESIEPRMASSAACCAMEVGSTSIGSAASP